MEETGVETVGRSVTFRAYGHPDVRGTHQKTVEFTTGPHITGRATCVVGVSADLDPESLMAFRGPVVLTLRAGGFEDRIRATANPRYGGGERAVVRRSAYRSSETFATDADKAAADLDRGLVAVLADPFTELEVTVEAAGRSSLAASEVVVLVGAAGLPAEAEARDALASAGAVLDAGADAGTLHAAEGHEVLRGEDGRSRAWAALERGEVVLLLGDPGREPAAAALLRDAADADVAIRVVGEPDARVAAVLATGLPTERCAFLGPGPGRRSDRGRQLAAAADLGLVAVWEGPVASLEPLLADVVEHHPEVLAGVVVAPGEPDESRSRGTARDLAVAGIAGRVRASPSQAGLLVVDLRGHDGDADAGLRTLVAALLREGVPARTLSTAIQQLPGRSRRRAYDLVQAVKDTLDQADKDVEGFTTS